LLGISLERRSLKVLLLQAHPDDEACFYASFLLILFFLQTMFFGPTILEIVNKKIPLFIISITGDSTRKFDN
jgi:hypothetical protein